MLHQIYAKSLAARLAALTDDAHSDQHSDRVRIRENPDRIRVEVDIPTDLSASATLRIHAVLADGHEWGHHGDPDGSSHAWLELRFDIPLPPGQRDA
ncbi:hypothetical protein [Streptomyces nanshensis]|uniref:Uncharacterized protein n=1 Tax=Streptomyces nanshensis TaxID=518642 RepID=A0A1E7L3X7_9ACTN|nr:hypothetical protein [Streptomyces nanshensis]OEV10916.1 hypothetical protein AN218_15360 [Streptomyces nanshensis]